MRQLLDLRLSLAEMDKGKGKYVNPCCDATSQILL